MDERRDKGEGAIAYVAIVGLVAAITVTLMGSGIGERISGSIGAAACRVVQVDACLDDEAPTGPGPPKGPPTVHCVQAPCPQPSPSPPPSGPRKPGDTIYCVRAPCPQPTPSRLPPS